MTPSTAGLTPGQFARRHRHTIGFITASIIWAAVIIDTGDIAWPLAMWMATALGPVSLHRRKTEPTTTGRWQVRQHATHQRPDDHPDQPRRGD